MAHRSVMNMDLGLSDDEDRTPPPRGGRGGVRGAKKEESISDLLSGSRKDSASMFGGPPRARSTPSFLMSGGGGGDPLDMLSQMGSRGGRKPPVEEPPDDEDLAFQLEMQKQMGMAGLDSSQGPSSSSAPRQRSASPMPRREASPHPHPSSSHGDGSDESLADIVGDILGDEAPARSPRRAQAVPAPRGRVAEDDLGSAAGYSRSGIPARGGSVSGPGSNAGTNEWDEDDNTPASYGGARSREVSGGPGGRSGFGANVDAEPRVRARSGSRPPLGGDVSHGPSEMGADRSPQQTSRRGGASEREGSRGPLDRSGGFAAGGETAADSHVGESFGYGADSSMAGGSFSATEAELGRRGGAGRRKLAPKPSDDDPLADMLGLGGMGEGGGSASSRPGPGRSVSPGPRGGGHEQGSVLPDTSMGASSLGGAPFDVELSVKPKRRLGQPKAQAQPSPEPARAVTPPPADRFDEPGHATPTSEGRGAASARASTPPLPPTPPASRAPPQDTSGNSSLDLDDLLQDNTAVPPKMATPPPKAATPPPSAQATAQGGDGSDSELPDFMRSRGEPRVRRGAASSRSSASVPPATPPKAPGFDLGFSAEDLDPSDRSASDPRGLPSMAGASGSGPLEVPLTAGTGGRRLGSAAGRSTPPAASGSGANSAAGHSAAPLASPSAVLPHAGASPSVSSVISLAKAAAAAQAPVGMASPAASSPQVGIPGTPGAGLRSASGSAARVPAQPVPGLPTGGGQAHYWPGQGLDPGSPLTQTAQSEGGSLRARFQVPLETAAAPSDPAQLRAAYAGAAAAAALAADAAAGAYSPERDRRSAAEGGPGTPASERGLSLFGAEQAGAPGGGYGGFSAFPPLAAAPSTDLLSKLAYSEAKVRQLELQLEDSEQRWQQRIGDARLQGDSERERMELQCRRYEAELDRVKEIHAGDLRHLNETKQMLLQSFETEKESARRDERRKASMDVEKVKSDATVDMEELRRKHERSLAIVQQQSDLELESLRRAHSGEHQLTKLVEQVQGSVAEVERMSKRVDTDKSMEWTVRERQLEAREKNVKEMEVRLSTQSKEVEEQRRRVSELLRNMESSQVDDRTSLSCERERLEKEHARLQQLQQCVREADRNNKEALRHAWAQVEDEKRHFQEEQLRTDGELTMRKEEVETQERQVRQEVDRLKALHQQIEVARHNASRRIRETESTVANERRCLMNDLEVFEEKRRIHATEAMKTDGERKLFLEDREAFEAELRNVGLMATEVERRSEEIRALHDQAGEARGEIQMLRGQLQDERSAQGTELERLKSMQTMIEQQRLQLLQTENQCRMKGIEDMDLLVMTQASFPYEGGNMGQGEAMMQLAGPHGGLPQALSEPITGGGGDFGRKGVELPYYPSAGALAGRRPTATPCRAGGGSSRVELQTLLRRTREASGEMQIYIQEQYRFLNQETGAPPQPWQQESRRDVSFAAQPWQQESRAERLSLPAAGRGFSAGFGGGTYALGEAGAMPSFGLGGEIGFSASSSDSQGRGDYDSGGPTLEAFRPLSSDLDGTSCGSTV
ncbi:unnamed protein product [Polarella glacialis]|uniref:Fas-binding factor 1 n=1 Tax=Polarella glacialis TaxID=89957 RepID=A0A813KET5_POLGL|nr:unnamed protein product [Polarella glacialis]CAE8702414.1 unnamed protein product [Polarella glacialis]